MKKRYIIVILSILFIYFVWDKYSYSTLKKSNYTLYEGQDLCINVIELENSKIKIKFSYEGHDKAIYGEDYVLEVKKGHTWYVVPYKSNELYIFNLVGYELESGSTWETDYSLIYGNLPPGKYRIIKSVSLKNKELIYISAYFTIS